MVASTVAVWIEDGDGTIVRGVAESVTRGGVLIRLSRWPRASARARGWPSASASTPRARPSPPPPG